MIETYVMLPLRLYKSEWVEQLKTDMKDSLFKITLPIGMFANSREWNNAFPKFLKPFKAGIILTDNGLVGKGVYRECEYLQSEGATIYRYDIEARSLFLLNEIKITDRNNWIDYARIS